MNTMDHDLLSSSLLLFVRLFVCDQSRANGGGSIGDG